MKWLWLSMAVFFLGGCGDPAPSSKPFAYEPIKGQEITLRHVSSPAGFPEGLQYVEAIPPRHLADSMPDPARNPLSLEGITLGRKLFFDTRLSANNQLSCASCHRPGIAFSDATALSNRGVSGKRLRRHAPSLMNLAWHQGLFWDGGARDLESLTFGPLTHPDEMAQDLEELVGELQADKEYPALFRQVFGDSIRMAYVARALAQFQRTLLSANSRYDRWVQGDGQALSALEQKGLAQFEENCASCHPPPFFTDFSYHNNGLESTFPTEWEHEGQGRYRITLQEEDMGKFKTPSLRNVTITAPYMHDGRFPTLQAALRHYAEGMQLSSTLDTAFRKGKALGIPLTQTDRTAIIAFLGALEDEG